jgi:hypothetical protein
MPVHCCFNFFAQLYFYVNKIKTITTIKKMKIPCQKWQGREFMLHMPKVYLYGLNVASVKELFLQSA